MTALLVLLSLLSSTFSHTVEMPHLEPTVVSDSQGGSALTAPGCVAGCVAGMPDLPVCSRWVRLPRGTRALSVSVKSARWEPLEGSWNIRPLPEPRILSRMDGQVDQEPDAEIWSDDAFWPESPVRLTTTSHLEDYPCAGLVVYPFRYNPVSRRLERLEELEITVATEPAIRDLPSPGRAGEYERMLIVTGVETALAFENLAHWRTSGGIWTEVVTTDEAFTWPGCDNAESLRNYIIDYRSQYGLDYLMLAGDTALIPCRFAFPMSYNTGGGRDDNMPCDLYYSDLDGDWNADGDSIWGELDDIVDLGPDVIVGRASVETQAEAWEFVNKTIAYEQAAITDHLEHGVFVAQTMSMNPYTPGAISKDYIDDSYVPESWEMTKLYESTYNYDPELLLEALNQGAGCLNISAHGWTSSAGILDPSLVNDVDSQGRYAGLAYATSCWSGAFDYECVVEDYVNHPDGCGVGFIANSSYGWGSPGNPLYGYSDRMDQSVYQLLFCGDWLTMGEVLAQAKTEYIPFAQQENCYRCILYMVNLIGDPALRPYRVAPVDPEISLPQSVSAQTTVLPVVVSVPGGSPQGAVVCVRSADLANYQVCELDGSGMVLVELDQPPAADLTVTVTGPGVRRCSQTVPFQGGPSLVVTEVSVSTPEGYWVPAPGCSASVQVTLQNQGDVPLSGVELEATLLSGPGQLLSSSIGFGDLEPGESSAGDDALELLVDASAQNGQVVDLSLLMSATGESWEFPLPLLVCGPGLYCCGYTVDDSTGGNGNGYAEAGEDFDLHLLVANTGLLTAYDVTGIISNQASWLTWTADSSQVDSVRADSTAVLIYSGSLDAGAPEPAFPQLLVDLEGQPEWSSQDSLTFTSGNMGFFEDVESGSPGWTHGGVEDLWHISSAGGHSGSSCWYNGQSDSTGYLNNMNCWLRTPDLYLAPEAELTFWSRFDLYLYGADGLYVIFVDLDEMQRDTLDFIGAGGLLPLKGPGGEGNMQWLPRTYDLSEYEAGTRCCVELGFLTDETNTGQGFWVDDISIDGFTTGASGTAPGSPVPGRPVGHPVPNPSVGSINLPVDIGSGPVRVSLYDLSGRLVWSTESSDGLTGMVSIPAHRLLTGVYLVRVTHAGGIHVEKAVLLGSGI